MFRKHCNNRRFNFPDTIWETNSAVCGRWDRFLTYIADNFIIQKVEEGTRVSAILVLILINRDEVVEGIKVIGILGKSISYYHHNVGMGN